MRLAMCSPRCNTNSASASQVPWLAMVFLLTLASRQPLVSADDGNAGIAVTGWGEVMARPTSLELHVKVTGTGTLGTDALTRFEQSRRELTEIVAAMQPQLVKLHAGGIAITPGGDPDMYWQTLAPGGEAGLSELAVSSVCRIAIGGLRVLPEQQMVELTSHLMDKLRDRGLALLPAQQAQALEAGAANDVCAARAPVGFVVEDLSAAQAEARRLAFLRAKASAEALAKLAGMRLGPVVAVQELSSGIDPEMLAPPLDEFEWGEEPPAEIATSPAGPNHARLVSRTSGPVPVRVELEVRFTMLSDDAPGGQDVGAALRSSPSRPLYWGPSAAPGGGLAALPARAADAVTGPAGTDAAARGVLAGRRAANVRGSEMA